MCDNVSARLCAGDEQDVRRGRAEAERDVADAGRADDLGECMGVAGQMFLHRHAQNPCEQDSTQVVLDETDFGSRGIAEVECVDHALELILDADHARDFVRVERRDDQVVHQSIDAASIAHSPALQAFRKSHRLLACRDPSGADRVPSDLPNACPLGEQPDTSDHGARQSALGAVDELFRREQRAEHRRYLLNLLRVE